MIFRILGMTALAIGVLSLAVLGWHGMGLKLGSGFEWLLTAYEEQSARFFSLFAEPLVRPALQALTEMTGVTYQLHPHWKHVVVLLWLNIGAESRNAWRMGNRGYSIFAGVSGVIISFIAGAASGVCDIDGIWSNALVAVFPMLGYLVWAFGALAFHSTTALNEFTFKVPGAMWWKAWREGFFSGAQYSVLRFCMGLLIVAAGTIMSLVSGVTVTGLAMLGAWVAFFAIYWLITGFMQARKGRTKMFDNADFQHGWIMISAIAGAAGLLSLGLTGG
jgi:hypothetical protein